MKNKWLAGFLNLIVPGLGYLYNGKRKVFSILLLAGSIIGFIALFINPELINSPLMNDPYLLISSVVMAIAFAYDAFQEAQSK